MDIQNRYDFVLLFDVQDGNPNGDPDAGNLPRLDPETGQGITTDVCIKRKVRNYVGIVKKEEPPFEIYVKEKAVLTKQGERAYQALTEEENNLKGLDKIEAAQRWMCQNFYDVRTFGAVMALKVNCGQVRGPVQLTFARSIDPVVALEHTITRMAVANEDEKNPDAPHQTMGRKSTIPYGLYRAHGFISAHLANQTHFSDEDLNLFWNALIHMFEHDHSAARGQMNTRGLYVFKHDSELGNAPSHELFNRIKINHKDNTTVIRNFNDYDISIDNLNLPSGVSLIRMVG